MINKSKFRVFFVCISLVILSCKAGPKPIEIGKDICAHCKMTIMDKRYGAEVITDKGKVYKFDSSECLIEYVRKNPLVDFPVRALLVINHSAPGEFIDATDAYFLHSEKLQSPMGGNLTAVHNKATIDKYILEYGGEVWTWEEALRNLQ